MFFLPANIPIADSREIVRDLVARIDGPTGCNWWHTTFRFQKSGVKEINAAFIGKWEIS